MQCYWFSSGQWKKWQWCHNYRSGGTWEMTIFRKPVAQNYQFHNSSFNETGNVSLNLSFHPSHLHFPQAHVTSDSNTFLIAFLYFKLYNIHNHSFEYDQDLASIQTLNVSQSHFLPGQIFGLSWLKFGLKPCTIW